MDEFGEYLGEFTAPERYLINVVRHMLYESDAWSSYEVQGELILEFRFPTKIVYLKKTPNGFDKYRKYLF